jgi:hypothetical protein
MFLILLVHFTFPVEIDNLEYSRIKATSVFVRLRIFSCSRLKYPTNTPVLHEDFSAKYVIINLLIIICCKISVEKENYIYYNVAFEPNLNLSFWKIYVPDYLIASLAAFCGVLL